MGERNPQAFQSAVRAVDSDAMANDTFWFIEAGQIANAEA
jgi:hypothetical protein